MKIVYSVLNIFHIICWFIGVLIFCIAIKGFISDDCFTIKTKIFNKDITSESKSCIEINKKNIMNIGTEYHLWQINLNNYI